MYLTISVLALGGCIIAGAMVVGFLFFLQQRTNENTLQYLFSQYDLRIRREQEVLTQQISETLARELHDDAGQQMIVLQQYTRRLKPAMPIDIYTQLVNLQQQLSFTLRELAYRYQDADLYHVSFTQMLAQLVNDLQVAGITRVSTDTPQVLPVLPAPVEWHLSRILQSLVANILQHAGASEVNLVVEINDNIFMLTVRDNGVGLDSHKLKKRSGNTLGWKSIYFRVQVLQGRVHLQSDAAGTCVQISIPISKAA
jgi:two-component system, NarL family, sensor kinase